MSTLKADLDCLDTINSDFECFLKTLVILGVISGWQHALAQASSPTCAELLYQSFPQKVNPPFGGDIFQSKLQSTRTIEPVCLCLTGHHGVVTAYGLQWYCILCIRWFA